MKFDIVSDPEKVKLISLLYEGYRMPHDELMKEMGVNSKKLELLLDEIEGLWETPRPRLYRLTERGIVAYGIIKSRNVKIKKATVARKKEKKSFLESIKEEFSKRFS